MKLNGVLRNEITAYFVLMVLIAISLPFSKFTLTVFEMMLVFVWLIHDVSAKSNNSDWGHAIQEQSRVNHFFRRFGISLSRKLRLFFSNKPALMLTSLFALHLIGLITTTDFTYAWKDIRTKLPLLILPLIIASMPRFSRRQTQALLGMFVLAVFVGTLISIHLYLKRDFDDIRDISPYISSVRFALMVVFSFFLLILKMFCGLPHHSGIGDWDFERFPDCTDPVITFGFQAELLENQGSDIIFGNDFRCRHHRLYCRGFQKIVSA